MTQKSNIRLLLGAVLLSWTLASAAWGQDSIKIAVVDLDRVVAMSQRGEALRDQLRQFEEQAQADIQAKTDSANAVRQQANADMTESQLADLQTQYEDKLIEIRRFREEKQREGQKMQADGLKEIEAALKPVMEAIRDEGAYDLIINKMPGLVLMANEAVDISAMVLERLNANG